MWLRHISAITILAFSLTPANTLAESNPIPPQLQAQRIETYTSPDPSQIVEELGLTEKQIAQLNQIRRQFSPLIEPLYEEWNEAQQELETLIVSADASETQVRQKYDDVEALRSQNHWGNYPDFNTRTGLRFGKSSPNFTRTYRTFSCL